MAPCRVSSIFMQFAIFRKTTSCGICHRSLSIPLPRPRSSSKKLSPHTYGGSVERQIPNKEKQFSLAREAAILIPKYPEQDDLPDGCAILAPLDSQGRMYPQGDHIIYCVEDGSGYGIRLWDFLDMTTNAALGIRYSGRYGRLGTCPGRDVLMAAIYDLDRLVISQFLQPSLLEDWAEEDRDDLKPPCAPSGTRDVGATRRLIGSGRALLHKKPGIIQFRNGQVLVQTKNHTQPVIFDHDDAALAAELSDVDLPGEVRRRIFGREDG